MGCATAAPRSRKREKSDGRTDLTEASLAPACPVGRPLALCYAMLCCEKELDLFKTSSPLSCACVAKRKRKGRKKWETS